MNHLELLKKYMQHVSEEEGIDFTGSLNNEMNQTRFTREEMDELQRISAEDWV